MDATQGIRIVITAAVLGWCIGIHQSAAAIVCGRQGLQNRIFGGSDSYPGEWPWYAILNYQGKPYCGGSLISNDYIITAAHCFDGDLSLRTPESWTIQLGSSRAGGPPEISALNLKASQILLHEDYIDFLDGHDLALIKLAKPVKFTNFISPVCLPEINHRFRLRKSCWALGLQDVAPGVPLDNKRSLQNVAQTLIGHKTCNCIYNSHGREELTNATLPSMLCAAESDGEKGPCLGDSGGPVVCKEDGAWFLAGVISFSQGCHLRDSPTVLTAVSLYQDWIKQKVGSKASFSPQTIDVTDDVDTDSCTDLLSTRNPGCGIIEIEGSGPSSPGVWPWQVDLHKDGRRMCGGALISANWVVTAAHCFTGTLSPDSPFDWSVVLSPGTPAMKEIPVQKINLHGAYISMENGKDIALLQLTRPASFGPYTLPICLPRASHRLLYGSTCWHTGWDGPHPDGKMGPPHGVSMELIGPNKCNCIYSQPGTTNQSVSVLPGMLCATQQEGQCLSDSGGPLVCKEKGTWFLMGVQSFGGSCQERREKMGSLPGVYTKLSDYEDWISTITRDAFFNLQIETPPQELDTQRCSEDSPRGCGNSVASPSLLLTNEATDVVWPWQVSIQQYGFHICSGVLITETWVLTAAHCISSIVPPSEYSVHLGKHHQDGHNPHQLTRMVKRVVLHPGHGSTAGDNDLALLETYYGVTYNDYIQPICPPPPDFTQSQVTKCRVTGWGELQSHGDPSSAPLKGLQVSLLDPKECGTKMSKRNPIRGTLLCAAGKNGRKFACLSDSGAPLVCQLQTKGPWMLFGISSSSAKPQQPVCPGNFTAVTSKLSWIREVIPPKDMDAYWRK
ncbi:serine protease 53 [Xenopus laevis]|uniref:Serine protease 53 n=1 Tax=Xenopus laevis TaxID=8355 RepID=A0A8J1LWE0_XENLA|nr:serine protease 53 [Xenopus laevis]OCT59040.1 hypothetical protein XELAEV_18001530mg [Xenopus laevis]